MIAVYDPDETTMRLSLDGDVDYSSNQSVTVPAELKGGYQRLRPPPVDSRKRRRMVFARVELPRCARHSWSAEWRRQRPLLFDRVKLVRCFRRRLPVPSPLL
jgi:hypothetical protein